MAFTTWTALKQTMLDDMASGRWRMKRYQCGEKTIEYATLAEFRDGLEYVEYRASREVGECAGRTFAAQGGRG